MLACSSGSMTPGQHAAGRRRATAGDPATGSWTGAPGSSGSGVRIMLINTGYILKICPAPGTVKLVNRVNRTQLAVLKALGDETRYAMYRELARSTAALSASELAERLGIHANTVRLHLERLREVGPGRRRGGPPGHGRAAPAPLLPQRRRARARVRPAGARAARRPARRARRAGRRRRRRRRRRRAGSGAPRPARRTRSRSCLDALEAELAKLGFEPALGDATAPTDAGPHRVPALPVPRAGRGLPRAGVQPPPRPVRGRGRCGRRGNSRGVRDVVRPRAVPRHGRGRIS